MTSNTWLLQYVTWPGAEKLRIHNQLCHNCFHHKQLFSEASMLHYVTKIRMSRLSLLRYDVYYITATVTPLWLQTKMSSARPAWNKFI